MVTRRLGIHSGISYSMYLRGLGCTAEFPILCILEVWEAQWTLLSWVSRRLRKHSQISYSGTSSVMWYVDSGIHTIVTVSPFMILTWFLLCFYTYPNLFHIIFKNFLVVLKFKCSVSHMLGKWVTFQSSIAPVSVLVLV